jgi:hypothetical protein
MLDRAALLALAVTHTHQVNLHECAHTLTRAGRTRDQHFVAALVKELAGGATRDVPANKDLSHDPNSSRSKGRK